jgi:hypothetical protein
LIIWCGDETGGSNYFVAHRPGDHGQEQAATSDDPQPSPADRAFDLFDAGKLGEAALLAAIGVSRDGYVPTEVITHRALDAVEQGRLSEPGLVKLLG